MKTTIAAVLSTFALLSAVPVHAQLGSPSRYSQQDLQFLTWLNQKLSAEDINPAIMPDESKILAAQDYCARLDSGDTVDHIQEVAVQRASQYEDPQSQRLMAVLLNSLLSGGVTYYCPQHLAQVEVAQLSR